MKITDSQLAACARRAAAEGMVLLRNEKHTLPFRVGERVAVFGRAQLDTYYTGTGSGGMVNAPYSVDLDGGLLKSGMVKLEEGLLRKYQDWVLRYPRETGEGKWAAEPWSQREMPVAEEDVLGAARNADKALVVLGRTGGEDKDLVYHAGSYLLSSEEENMLAKVASSFSRVAVVFNTGSIIDMSWADERFSSLLLAYQGGQETGNAIADVLTGKINPSGKLTDTIAKQLNDYPSTSHFGDDLTVPYTEDIYVGYRYFETFAPERVLYPFGFGLSYTSFAITPGEACCGDGGMVAFPVEIMNTGFMYAGKDVIQVYFQAPQGKLGKPVLNLLRFQKTKMLGIGERCVLDFAFRIEEMASYDDSGKTGHPYAYVLEAGDYSIWVGDSCRNLQEVTFAGGKRWQEKEDRVTKQLEQVMAPEHSFLRLTPQKGEGEKYMPFYEQVPVGHGSLEERIASRLPASIPFTGDKGITLDETTGGKRTLDEFIAQLSDRDLAALARGEGQCSLKVTQGTGGAFGGMTRFLLEHKVPIACGTDGPSGIRLDTGCQTSQIPIGTLLASTWDLPLVESLYACLGEECVAHGIDVLFAPGMNIHRNPLCGRNYEYFSEDPYVTGKMASAVCKGLGSRSVWGTAKHFCCNNQEHDRGIVNSMVSERALREIYLRGFEIAVAEGSVHALMTSYNRVNGHWSASNYDLNTTILRKEWRYHGLVMTDWWANLGDVCTGKGPDRLDTASMVRAGNNLYMVVDNDCAGNNLAKDNLVPGEHITRGELQNNAWYICTFLTQTLAFRRPVAVDGMTLPFLRALPDIPEMQRPDDKGEWNFPLKDKIWLSVPENGRYRIYATYRSDGWGVTQGEIRMFLDGKPFILLVVNGTNGMWRTSHLLNVQLGKGCHELEMHVGKRNIELKKCSFVKELE